MDWESREITSRTKRFWLGVFVGFLAAVFVLAGVWSVWQIGAAPDAQEATMLPAVFPKQDVGEKLDQINGLIERLLSV